MEHLLDDYYPARATTTTTTTTTGCHPNEETTTTTTTKLVSTSQTTESAVVVAVDFQEYSKSWEIIVGSLHPVEHGQSRLRQAGSGDSFLIRFMENK
jgi:hypothetical protein